MKKYTLFVFAIFTSTLFFCQKQANIWYFGNGVGLDFNNECNPTVLTDGAITGNEGCATISDNTTGELLFYTNSTSVWNKNHSIMLNGNLVSNGSTITQVLIIKKPGLDSIYYIITSEVQGFSGQGYRFHKIDMNLNSGLGGIVFKDSILYLPPVTEKITAVKHSNGTDIWLICHEYNSNKFLSFKLNSSGINTMPVISSIGKIHFDDSSLDAIGEMKASPDGTKLAVVTLSKPNIELFDFNNSSGQVSNLITIPENGGYDTQGNVSGLYGLSFSSDNSKLYASQWQSISNNVSAKIIQYDITSSDSIIINNSRVDVFTTSTKNLYSLKLAPNKKIYVGQNLSNQYLGVINYPNATGLSCNYIDNGLYLNGKNSSWGLNNLMEYDSYCSELEINEMNNSVSIKLYPNPASQKINISIPTESDFQEHGFLLDASGRTIKTFNLTGTKTEIDIADLLSGVYFVRIGNAVEKISVE